MGITGGGMSRIIKKLSTDEVSLFVVYIRVSGEDFGWGIGVKLMGIILHNSGPFQVGVHHMIHNT